MKKRVTLAAPFVITLSACEPSHDMGPAPRIPQMKAIEYTPEQLADGKPKPEIEPIVCEGRESRTDDGFCQCTWSANPPPTSRKYECRNDAGTVIPSKP